MENKKLFDKYREGSHWEKHPTVYTDGFISFLRKENVSANILIVDLGCGNGRDVNHFNVSGIHAIGFDNDKEILEDAKQKSEYPAAFYPCDIERLPFLDTTQDAYFCINVMHYINASKVLSEIYRTLKPGGYAFIHFNLLIIDQNYTIDYHQTRSEVYELVNQFAIVEEKIFLREDTIPQAHIHHIMQVILKR